MKTLIHLLTSAIILLNCTQIQASHMAPTPKNTQANDKIKPENHKHGQPPQQAIDICLNQAVNSQCQVRGPSGPAQGFCEFTPDNKYFACNPQRSGQRPESATATATTNKRINE